MPAARLIVCEKSPHWASALRTELAGRLPQVIETRSLASAMSALAEAPASLVLVQITEANLEAALDWLNKVGLHYPQARAIAALAPELAPAESLLREAGAIDAHFGTHQAASVARAAQRQLALAPHEPLSLSQSIAERMPWSSAANAQG